MQALKLKKIEIPKYSGDYEINICKKLQQNKKI